MTREYGYFDKELGTVVWVPYRVVQDAQIHRRNNPKAPSIISDTIAPTKHPGTGEMIESRSAFEMRNKALGLVPFDPPKDWNGNGINKTCKPSDISEDVDQAYMRAYNDLKWGNQKLTHEQKLKAKDINDKLEGQLGSAKLGKD